MTYVAPDWCPECGDTASQARRETDRLRTLVARLAADPNPVVYDIDGTPGVVVIIAADAYNEARALTAPKADDR